MRLEDIKAYCLKKWKAYDTVFHSFSKKVQKQLLTVDKIKIRPIRPEEYPLLEDFLYYAIFFSGWCPRASKGDCKLTGACGVYYGFWTAG